MVGQMKSIIIAIFISIAVNSYASENINKMSPVDYFRGIKWGTNLSKTKGMKLTYNDRRWHKFYVREAEIMKIYGATVNEIVYVGDIDKQSKLMSAYIVFSGVKNYNIIRTNLIHEYGPIKYTIINTPEKVMEVLRIDLNGKSVGVLLQFSPKEDNGQINYDYNPHAEKGNVRSKH